MNRRQKARILAAAPLRSRIARALRERIKRARGIPPTLAIVSVSPPARSRVYMKEKEKFGREIGALVEQLTFSRHDTLVSVTRAIQSLNKRRDVHGIILQLPLPRRFDASRVKDSVSPEKDVDGLSAQNVAALSRGERGIVPATARGITELLDYYKIPIRGQRVVVIGRSNLVGKPIALRLLALDATVTMCHSRTRGVQSMARAADIVVTAVGVPRLLRARGMRRGQVIIDVGITAGGLDESGSRIQGDVDFPAASRISGAVTPVPGGVGPMTVAALFENLVDAWEKSRRAR